MFARVLRSWRGIRDPRTRIYLTVVEVQLRDVSVEIAAGCNAYHVTDIGGGDASLGGTTQVRPYQNFRPVQARGGTDADLGAAT